MKSHLTHNAGHIIDSIGSHRQLLSHALLVAGVVGLLAAFALSVPWGVAAQDTGGGRACSERTLHGDYGLVGTGLRGLGPGASETFATVSMVTYDGLGGFSAIGISHGQVTGVREGLPVTGTYFVNPDCTGGQTTNIPGVPPLEDRFVIVDNGREVRTVVVAPLTTIATANLRKK
jgi:hypothetical protein